MPLSPTAIAAIETNMRLMTLVTVRPSPSRMRSARDASPTAVAIRPSRRPAKGEGRSRRSDAPSTARADARGRRRAAPRPPPLELRGEGVVLDQRLARDTVETVHQAPELEHRHLPSQLARTADVGEQHRDIDLGAADVSALRRRRTHRRLTSQTLEAACAHLR